MLLSMFGIVLGVAGILAIGVTNATALSSITSVFSDAAGKTNLSIISAKADEGFAEGVLRRVSQRTGIAAAIPILRVQTVLADEAPPPEIGLSFFGSGVEGLTLHGIDPQLEPLARDYKLTAGRFLSDDPNADEVVLVETYANDKDIRLGKAIQVATPGGAEDLRVVGLMAKEGPGLTNSGAFGVIPLTLAQKLFDRVDELDQIDIIASPQESSSAGLEGLKTSLQNALGKDYSVIFPAAQGKRMSQMLGTYSIGLNFLSGMALFVGAFLIYNAFSMTVVERTREFGLMRLVGMTAGQVRVQVLVEAAVLGVLGSLLGLALGVLMAQGLSQLMGTLLAQDLTQMQIPPDIVATSVLVGVCVTVLAAMLPAWQAGRISPLEALRQRASGQAPLMLRYGWLIGGILLAISAAMLLWNPFPYDVQFRMGSMVVFSLFLGATLIIPLSVNIGERLMRPVVRLVYGSSGRLGSRNVRRAVLRTTLTVAALMIGVSMVIVVRGMTEPFKYDLQSWLDAYIGGDLYVSSSVGMGSRVWRRLESVEGVAAVAPVRYFDTTWLKPNGGKETLILMGIDPAQHTQVTSFVFAQGQDQPQQAVDRLAAGDAVFISTVLAEKYGLHQGDALTLNTRSGPHDFEIAAVVTDFYNQGLVAIGSWDDMRRYFRISDASAFLLSVADGYSTEDVRARIDALYGKRDHLTIESNQAIKERIFRLMGQAFSMFDVLAMIAVLVASLGIVNTLTMNVMERTQEIGMLRGLGMTRGQVVLMLLAEAGMIGLVGGLLGLVLGVILSSIFLQSMTAMSGYQLTYILPTQGIAVGLVLSIVVAHLAAALPARRAARVRILDAIHYE